MQYGLNVQAVYLYHVVLLEHIQTRPLHKSLQLQQHGTSDCSVAMTGVSASLQMAEHDKCVPGAFQHSTLQRCQR